MDGRRAATFARDPDLGLRQQGHWRVERELFVRAQLLEGV
jgi:hypothetical protein